LSEPTPKATSGERISSGARVAVMVNPDAGSDDRPELPERVVVEEMSEAVDLAGSFRHLVSEGAVVIGVVGGDGSTGCAAGVAADLDVALWPIPGGTLNHFSRALGVETFDDAIEALATGHTRHVDLGDAGGVPFVNNASIGMYGDLVRHRERLEDRLPVGKWMCAGLAAVRTVASACALRLEIDGRPERVFMVFVGNNRYDGIGQGTRQRLDEGLLDVVVLCAPRRFPRLTLMALAATGRFTRSRFVKRTAQAQVRVRVAESTSLAFDGEARPITGEVLFRSRRAALRVVAPSTDP
jgi:diacylglycerol kinase family enzyme